MYPDAPATTMSGSCTEVDGRDVVGGCESEDRPVERQLRLQCAGIASDLGSRGPRRRTRRTRRAHRAPAAPAPCRGTGWGTTGSSDPAAAAPARRSARHAAAGTAPHTRQHPPAIVRRAIDVARLELVGVGSQRSEVPDAVERGAGGEHVGEGERRQRREPAADRRGSPVVPSARPASAIAAAPEAQSATSARPTHRPVAPGTPARTRRARVVDVEHGEPTGGPVLRRRRESRTRGSRRAPSITTSSGGSYPSAPVTPSSAGR